MNPTNQTALSPEERLLIYASRFAPEHPRGKIVDELLQSDLDWQQLYDRSIAHGLTPMLFKRLQEHTNWWSAVPEPFKVRFEEAYRRNLHRNQLLLEELERLLARLDKAGISVMLMKELHLLHTVYPDIGVRPVGDLDLLILKKDLIEAKSLLHKSGYDSELRLNPYKERYGFGYHFVCSEKDIWVDLQWNLCQREWADGERKSAEFRGPIDEVWSRAKLGNLNDARAWRMSWEDLLFHLCLHAEGHGFEELVQLYDIAHVVDGHGGQLDWQTVVATARASQVKGSIYTALRFVRDVLAADVPDDVLDMLRPDYLKFELYAATFLPLGRLHSFLDETANDRRFPAASHWKWEWIVRRGTVDANRHVYEVIDFVCHRLSVQGLRPFVVMTCAPERWLPHPRLHGCGSVAILAAANGLSPRQRQIITKHLDRIASSEWVQTWPRLSYAAGPPGFYICTDSQKCRRQLRNLQRSVPASSLGLIKKLLFPRRPRRSDQTPIYLLSAEDLLLRLCLWFYRNSTTWIGLCTVSEALREHAPKLNWEAFWQQARTEDATSEAAAALLCAQELSDISLPESAFSTAGRTASPGTVNLFPPLFMEKEEKPQKLEKAISTLLRFLALPSFGDRRQYLAGILKDRYKGWGIVGLVFRSVIGVAKLLWMWLQTRRRAGQIGSREPRAYWLEGPYQVGLELGPLPEGPLNGCNGLASEKTPASAPEVAPAQPNPVRTSK
jgi:hypothetical protein